MNVRWKLWVTPTITSTSMWCSREDKVVALLRVVFQNQSCYSTLLSRAELRYLQRIQQLIVKVSYHLSGLTTIITPHVSRKWKSRPLCSPDENHFPFRPFHWTHRLMMKQLTKRVQRSQCQMIVMTGLYQNPESPRSLHLALT